MITGSHHDRRVWPRDATVGGRQDLLHRVRADRDPADAADADRLRREADGAVHSGSSG